MLAKGVAQLDDPAHDQEHAEGDDRGDGHDVGEDQPEDPQGEEDRPEGERRPLGGGPCRPRDHATDAPPPTSNYWPLALPRLVVPRATERSLAEHGRWRAGTQAWGRADAEVARELPLARTHGPP